MLRDERLRLALSLALALAKAAESAAAAELLLTASLAVRAMHAITIHLAVLVTIAVVHGSGKATAARSAILGVVDWLAILVALRILLLGTPMPAPAAP